MRKIVYKLLAFIVLSVSCTNCNSERALDRVEQSLMTEPEIALQEIREIDSSRLRTKRAKARYSLLYVRALDKNRIDTTDVSILQPAVDYYCSKGSPKEKAYTFYYLGTIQCNAGDYYSSIMSLMDAMEEAESLDDNWIKGMICSLMGISFNLNHLNKEELEYKQKAYDYFCAYGDSTYIDHAKYNLAVAFHNNRHFELADSLLSTIHANSKVFSQSLRQRGTTEIMRPDGDAGMAVHYFMNAIKEGSYFSTPQCFQYAYALYKAGYRTESGRLYESIQYSDTDAVANWWNYMLSKESGNGSDALRHLESFTQNSDSLICSQLSQSLYKAGSEHVMFKKEKAEKDAKTSRIMLMLIATIMVIIVLITCLIYQHHLVRVREDKALLEQQLSSAHQMLEIARKDFENEEKQRDDVLHQLRCCFASMYQHSFNEIGKLYGKNLELSFMVDKGVEQYKKKVSAILKELSDDKHHRTMFEARVNNDLDNILDKIRADFPSFGPETIRFLSYVIVGFDAITISSILGEQSSASRMRKSRLMRQILETDTPNHDLYKTFL